MIGPRMRGNQILKPRILAAVFGVVFLTLSPAWCQSDWPMYGHDEASTRYSPLKQVNTDNVQHLTLAWTYHLKTVGPRPEKMGPAGRGGGRRLSEATPIMVNDTLYLPTPYLTIVALNPETGEEIWSYKFDKGRPGPRGVSYWPGDKITPASILCGTSDGRLLSLDAKTGKPTAGFGTDGYVDLKADADNGFPHAQYTMNSPPSIYKDLVITGASVQELPAEGASGDIRAWDLHTGKLVWRFHSVPQPGEVGHDTWPGDSWKNRSGTNVWGLMSVDVKQGLVLLPFGSPTYDFYAPDRKGKNLFGNAIVALHADTGKLAWYFQTVHHDVFDYDLESAPVLMDINKGGAKIPAVAVLGKNGLLFILDRRNGTPVFGVEERPVPASTAPDEEVWPTQPFPVKPEPLGRMSFRPDEIATVTPEQKKYCEDLLATEGGMENRGAYTSFGLKLTIQFPGTIGAANWPGMSYDPKLGYLFVNTNNLGDVGKLVKNPEGTEPPYERHSPWGDYARFWNNDKFWPCQQPPWGQLWAINANTGEVAWKIPFGTIPELDAKGVHGTGSLNFGGTIATAGGLVFIAATNDHLFHAFDAKTGKLLWQTTLESGSYTTPMTYEARNGKQYVVLVATGGSFFDMTAGDSVFAFALPGGLPTPKAMQSATNDAESPASQPQSAQTTAPVADSAAMPDGAGKAIVQKQCAVCHAVTVVTAKHASRSEWEQVVNQMVSRGADLSDDDIDTVLEYLTKNYGPLDQMTTPPAGANAPR
jgi:glucose dehydrogenase/cytochrome c5